MTENRLYYPILVFLLCGLIFAFAANFGTGKPAGIDDAPKVRNTVTMTIVVTGEP